MSSNIEEIKATLKKYGQEHLLNHYDTLNEAHQKKLLEEIEEIDFPLIDSLYKGTKKEEEKTKETITPIDFLDKYKLNDDYKRYEKIGQKAIKNAELGVVTMAAGQGR